MYAVDASCLLKPICWEPRDCLFSLMLSGAKVRVAIPHVAGDSCCRVRVIRKVKGKKCKFLELKKNCHSSK